ncbi:MAG: adenylyltransferase/cytidyltransferase family protein [Campylobacterales bacterium]|nr:adenylyltransferase/cytidyltransferase family protein [Campylobacterales bacterium]
MKKEIPLAVMRMQPIHLGHKLLIETMLDLCDENTKPIVCLGSVQEFGTEKNPYTYEQRKEMVEAVFGKDTLIIIPLKDLGAVSKKQWTDFVLGEVSKVTDLKPTIYFAGSQEDTLWWDETLPTTIVNRDTLGRKISATEVRRRIKENENIFDIIPKEIKDLI